MGKIKELELAKELIRFPSITPKDAGAINFLSKKKKVSQLKIYTIDLEQANLTFVTLDIQM